MSKIVNSTPITITTTSNNCPDHHKDHCTCFSEQNKLEKKLQRDKKVNAVLNNLKKHKIDFKLSNVDNVVTIIEKKSGQTIHLSLKSKKNNYNKVLYMYRFEGNSKWYESFKDNFISRVK